MLEDVKYSYISIAFGLTALLQIPQAIIATYLIETNEEYIILLTSIILTTVSISIASVIASDYLEKKLLAKFYSQPALVGTLLINAIQWLIFLWVFLELMDHALFSGDLINLYVFSQTISFSVIFLGIIYLSRG